MAADEKGRGREAVSTNVTRRTVLGAGAAATALAATGAGPAAGEAESDPSLPDPARDAPAVDYVCGRCGGDSVTRDAWAEWDVEAQDWVLGAAFDYAYCHDCEEETNLEEVQAGGESAG